MKTLKDYIFETRYFKFTDDERSAVAEIVGFLTGAIGEAADIKKYSEYWGVLSNDGKEQMHDLYDVLSNEQDWPVINRNNIKDDIELLANFLNWVDENDLWGDVEIEGRDALEKLES